jgi:hypothetical protein
MSSAEPLGNPSTAFTAASASVGTEVSSSPRKSSPKGEVVSPMTSSDGLSLSSRLTCYSLSALLAVSRLREFPK